MSDIFDFEPCIDDYAVMGNPVSHSKSPQIHHAFAEQTRQHIHYSAIQVDPGGFPQAVGNFFASGGKGLNVTVPFKTEAFKLAEQHSERAGLAGAVNTLLMCNNELMGDNTDGTGLVNDLRNNLHISLAGARILILGAGGASRGVLLPLLNEQPKQLLIANRTPDKADKLAKLFSRYGNVTGIGFTALGDGTLEKGAFKKGALEKGALKKNKQEESTPASNQFDIVINATSASLKGELPPISANVFAANAWCYDMMYGAEPTVFMQWAAKHGVKNISDGLGMLVEQAAESFFLWRNVRPDTQAVITQIRNSIA